MLIIDEKEIQFKMGKIWMHINIWMEKTKLNHKQWLNNLFGGCYHKKPFSPPPALFGGGGGVVIKADLNFINVWDFVFKLLT